MRKTVVLAAATVTLALVTGGCAQPAPEEAAIDYFVKGELLAEVGEVDAALAELAKAVKIDPELSVAHTAIGDIHRHRGDWAQAREAYETACQTNPFAFRAHYNLGVTYQALAEQVVDVTEQFRTYLTKAVEVYLRAIVLSPGDFDSHLNISACYFELGEMDKAEQYCLAAVQIDPASPAAQSNLGTIQEYRGELYEAIASYKASLEQDAHQPWLLVRLGSVYMRQGRLKAALQSFQAASQEAPASSIPWEKTGACYFYLRDFAKAQDAYAKALELDAGSAAAHRGMGVTYMAQYVMDRSRTDLRDKALEQWNTSLDIQPKQDDLKQLVKKYTPLYEGPEL